MPCAKKIPKKSSTRRRRPAFSYYFGTPRPLPSIPEPGFQQCHTSSRPRRYCRKTQLRDTIEDFRKKRPRNSHFRHLKCYVSFKSLMEEDTYEHFFELADNGFSSCSDVVVADSRKRGRFEVKHVKKGLI